MRAKGPVNPGRHRFLRAAAGVARDSIPLAAHSGSRPATR